MDEETEALVYGPVREVTLSGADRAMLRALVLDEQMRITRALGRVGDSALMDVAGTQALANMLKRLSELEEKLR